MSSVTRASEGELVRVLRDYRRRLETLERARGDSLVVALPEDPHAGQSVRYKPYGAGTLTTWGLTWDAAANGGAGAWSYTGGSPAWALQGGAGGNHATASVVTTVPMVGSPALTLPVGGMWEVSAHGTAQAMNAASTDALVWLAQDGTATAAVASLYSQDGAFDMHTPGLPVFIATTVATVLTLRVGTNGQTVDFGSRIRWRMVVRPVELRP